VNPALELARLYFAHRTITYRVCNGDISSAFDGTTPRHYSIDNAQERSFNITQLTSWHHQLYHGDLSEWLADWVQISTKNLKDSDNCWQRFDDDGGYICQGQTKSLRMTLSIPVMLIIEIESSTVQHGGNNCLWSAPTSMYPLKRSSAKDGIVYDLVGRGMFRTSETHYTSRHCRDKNMYLYNGLGDGLALRQTNCKIGSFLSAKRVEPPLLKDETTWAFVYRLRGGLEAQQDFYKHQLNLACQTFGVYISNPELSAQNVSFALNNTNIEPLPNEIRYWLKNPESAPYTDYRDISAPLNVSSTEELEPVEGNIDSQLIHPTPTPSPSEDWVYDCRCGINGPGQSHEVNEPLVFCESCDTWSHIACQRDGRASNMSGKTPFGCDNCFPPLRNSVSTLLPATRRR
jgi:hypothetical protein